MKEIIETLQKANADMEKAWQEKAAKLRVAEDAYQITVGQIADDLRKKVGDNNVTFQKGKFVLTIK